MGQKISLILGLNMSLIIGSLIGLGH